MSTRWSDAHDPPINPADSASAPLPDAEARLRALCHQARAQLHALRHPETDWMPELQRSSDSATVDVAIAGAGQGGLAVAALLKREKVGNILVFDKATRDREGIWRDFARMPIIRSPKHYPGPDMGMASLTYEAWHRARFGDSDWQRISLVPTDCWQDYLGWVRDTLEIEVQNQTRLQNIEPAQAGLRLTLQTPSGVQSVFARRLVLATGHDGTGSWWMPDYLQALPSSFRAHATDPIDFTKLRGRRVAVLGVGASAGDNAICALEAGASQVQMFCRRDTHRRRQVYRWCIRAGFMRHFGELSDEWRWRFMHYILNVRMGMPPDTWQRLASFDNFELVTGCEWQGARECDQTVNIESNLGQFEADFIIAGTGHDQDLSARPELQAIAPHAARWSDRYTPPANLRDERLGRYPYIGKHFEFCERVAGEAPWLKRVFDFTFGPTMSFGPSGCSISTLRLTAPMLVAGVTRSLFLEDVEYHFDSMINHPNFIP